jgi:putative nucleotidyltransferase with HDIG domain
MTSEQFYNYHKTLLEASKGMVLITDTRKLLYIIVYVVKKHMKLKSACIFHYDEGARSFILRSKRGEVNIKEGYRIDESHPLIKCLKDKKSGFSYNEDYFKGLTEARGELEKLGCVACVPSFNKGNLIGFLILGSKKSGDSYTDEELELLLTIANEVAIVIENSRNLLELQRLKKMEKENYFQTILALARTVDEKDAYTRGHLDEVTKYGIVVAEELANLKNIKIDMEELKTGLMLHDIGKIGVPDALLHKSSKLTTEEFEIMKQHTEIGARIIEPIKKLKRVGRIIRHHQEKYDGTGYPDGIKGEEIPVEARIIAVVDAYHAMISDRPYRKALSEEIALNELKSNMGTQFDPQVVEAFIRAYEKGKITNNRKNVL